MCCVVRRTDVKRNDRFHSEWSAAGCVSDHGADGRLFLENRHVRQQHESVTQSETHTHTHTQWCEMVTDGGVLLILTWFNV